MADDLNPAKRKEVEDHLAVLEPQIEGFEEWARLELSKDAAATVAQQTTIKDRRRSLGQVFLTKMDEARQALADLEDDGYPNLPPALIEQALVLEFQKARANLLAAFDVLKANQATGISVRLGAAEDKP